METKSLKVEISVHATPDQGHLSLGFLNSVLISQSWVIEEFFVDESDDGNITSLGSYPDSFSFPDMPSLLRFQDFTPSNVHQQIKGHFKSSTIMSCLDLSPIILLSNPEEETCLKDPC
ncbi:BnaA04g14460D [Brassica napus]|uniref:(rape) hypothetical protein n=1 Tax=Brassica napus TaxID=3708 RepID=A0A078IAE2_BRANA|nr:unnamed protein product [Brassica napus]CDY46158.1 BnaA04g14460D [Brassica napus]